MTENTVFFISNSSDSEEEIINHGKREIKKIKKQNAKNAEALQNMKHFNRSRVEDHSMQDFMSKINQS